MFVTTADMLKNKPQKYSYAETERWLKKIRRESDEIFKKLGEYLKNKGKPIPYELIRSDTKYNDGSWSPIFRVLRPERIEQVVSLIKSSKCKTCAQIEKATHLRNLISPIIKRWMDLFDQLDIYYGNPQVAMLLKTQFKSLATYNKLFVLDTERISSGEMFDKDAYKDVFNGFVKYYNDFVSRSAASSLSGIGYSPKPGYVPVKRGAPKLSKEQLERRNRAAKFLIQKVREKFGSNPDQVTVKDINDIANGLYSNGGKNGIPGGDEADFAPFLNSRQRDRWARANADMSFRSLCISSDWEKTL